METIDCEKLIQLVFDQEILYNQQLPDYMDKTRKHNVWAVIATEMEMDG